MKKLYSFAIGLAFCMCGQSQVIPCSNLETWVNSNETGSTFLIPQGWITFDQIENAFSPTYTATSTARTTSSHTGTYAALLQTGISGPDTMGGWMITSADVNTFFNAVFGGGWNMGFPYTTRPANLTGWHKLTRVGGDTAAIGVYLTKWNSSMGTRDTLASAEYFFMNNAATYTSFSIPVTYSLNLFPDTAIIMALIDGPNGGKTHVGTQFFLDDLAFTGTVPIGVKELPQASDLIRVYPNPFSNSATLELATSLNLNRTRVIIYNSLGSEVRMIADLPDYMISLERQELESGIYFYRLLGESGILANGKFVIE